MSIVRKRLSAAVNQRNHVTILQFVRLYPPLGLDEGLQAYIGYLKKASVHPCTTHSPLHNRQITKENGFPTSTLPLFPNLHCTVLASTTSIAHDSASLEHVRKQPKLPPSTDPYTGVRSRDLVLRQKTGLSGRIYIPKSTRQPSPKLPLLVYFHGGGFCTGSAFIAPIHNYSNSRAAKANIVILSVEYRKAPRYPLPIAYNDSWDAVKWVAAEAHTSDNKAWLKKHVDFNGVFFAGDSAGANIAHNMAMRTGSEKLKGIKLAGIVLIHPFLWAEKPLSSKSSKAKTAFEKLWRFVNPSTRGLSKLGCNCLHRRERSSGGGELRKDMKHDFHLNPKYGRRPEAKAMLKRVASFIVQNEAKNPA
ncbi:hypothetical protein RJ639_030516 [Escallonia herrerae]|uniref:Alpha/beta hydrolase fold-3 domain-containing protein n=1 Tax=Escallonia herrerae TaxID=1293975 RepID=A0AA88WZ28_9ASTE|nr:hypothetical protein RJ639_030516 [Escallonia herrerae]